MVYHNEIYRQGIVVSSKRVILRNTFGVRGKRKKEKKDTYLFELII